ncbi:hypothetical protein CHLRE_16g663776v5 [Chlamydomonas reinhardtii]|uniref:Uncharacterized protein n=1 Tax=Chlamydomonas reinhardtii TaxID=3055 RepID=A0A2K3CTP6_CHLRE|nr:uncharacterized protein CHLRE_16g663776v5 [Chlamydomonas reinhardtii]PNW71664.1 hypothetical protein CHLRE_16g663776v5 [Chlamydomonas reinhardtii]
MRSKAGSASSAGDPAGSSGVSAVQPPAPAAAEQHQHRHQQEQLPRVPGSGPMSVAADAAYLSVPTIRGEVEAETGQHAGAAGRREDLQEAVDWMMERSER